MEAIIDLKILGLKAHYCAYFMLQINKVQREINDGESYSKVYIRSDEKMRVGLIKSVGTGQRRFHRGGAGSAWER